MNRRAKQFFSSLAHAEGWVFLAATVFLFLFGFLELQLHVFQASLPRSFLLRIFQLVLICLLYYVGGMLYVERTGRRGLLPRLVFFFFLLYLYLILNATLFEKGFGRDHLVTEGEDPRTYYLRYYVNLVPFQSIEDIYVNGLIRGYVSIYYVLLNLLGNVGIFMPLAFFLPALFRAQRHWYVFMPTLILSVVTVELLQFIFMVGSCDVDDLILNVMGGMLFFLFLRLPPLSRMADRFCGRGSAPPTDIKNNGGLKS